MARVLLVHDWDATPESAWYPQTSATLKAAGFDVKRPTFPSTPNPQAWRQTLSDAIGEPDENTYLIGHGIGCAVILHDLETRKIGESVGGVVLVAGTTNHSAPLAPFFESERNLVKARLHAFAGFIAIHSDNDPTAEEDPLRDALLYLQRLRAKVIILPDGDHFDDTDSLPEVAHSVIELSEKN